MKVIKNINNNVARCSDSMGREVVVFGKGIGFFKTGEEIPLERINRTFYNIKDTDFSILHTIPTKIINAAIQIIDEASLDLHATFPSSAALALADHIQFAIERKSENIYLEPPLLQDIQLLYPKEMDMAHRALDLIQQATGEILPEEETGTLALHFINDRIQSENEKKIDTSRMIFRCASIIEESFSIQLDKNSFNYSRFITHLDYLIRRLYEKKQIVSQNEEIYEQLRGQYPETHKCAKQICDYLSEKSQTSISNEEVMYLMLHINRLISRNENK